MSEGAAYSLCRRDPEFAEQYADAFSISRLGLEEMAILYAKTGGKASAAPGETASPDLEKLCRMTATGYEGPGRSPDCADAMVWAMAELLLGGDRTPRVRRP